MNPARTLVSIGVATMVLALPGCDDDVTVAPGDAAPTVAGTTETEPPRVQWRLGSAICRVAGGVLVR